MTNHIDPKQIAEAREWARDNLDGGYFHGGGRALAAAKIILSLPDQIIDAEKVRELLDRWGVNPFPTSAEVAVLNDVEALLPTTPRPTLDDLIEEGHDPAESQWMQAEHRDERCIIIRINGQTSQPTVSLLTATGATIWTSTDEVIPLPDLPRLVWPASEPESDEEVPNDSTEPQVGEAWLVNTREGEQREALKAGNRWYVKDDDDVEEWVEEALTPIARLVPEVHLAPGGVLIQEALDKLNTPEPQEGEAWEVKRDGLVRNMIRTQHGWVGNHGRYSDSYSPQTPVQRLVPEVAPKVLVTEEDYENAPEGTICAADGHFPLYFPFYNNTGVWRSTSGFEYDHRDLAGTPRSVLRWGMGEWA